MPKKITLNQISLQEHEDVLSFFTFSKKNHFASDAKLYDALATSIHGINCNYQVHLTTYPYIAVHVSFGLTGGLGKDKTRIEQTIQSVLEAQLRQT